jgi:hypothetical protein
MIVIVFHILLICVIQCASLQPRTFSPNTDTNSKGPTRMSVIHDVTICPAIRYMYKLCELKLILCKLTFVVCSFSYLHITLVPANIYYTLPYVHNRV